jgi:LysR family glycine cleavage system transcriptional activator
VPQLPPLTELRVFEAAARHLSFKAAAVELGVTPTAISHQIRLLETYCGRQLFRRRPRPLSLTTAGAELFPAVREGLGRCSDALAEIKSGGASRRRLGVTATNAFAARWLLPRLPLWRKAHPRVRLDVVGTDAVIDPDGGEVDVAIRYARTPPPGFVPMELARDRFQVVASPALVGSRSRRLTPGQLAGFPLITYEWEGGPSWERWEEAARARHKTVPALSTLASLGFREELHAIEAIVAGQGIGICSDVVVDLELAQGRLVRVSDITLPGYGFYAVYRPNHPRKILIEGFLDWMRGLI